MKFLCTYFYILIFIYLLSKKNQLVSRSLNSNIGKGVKDYSVPITNNYFSKWHFQGEHLDRTQGKKNVYILYNLYNINVRRKKRIKIKNTKKVKIPEKIKNTKKVKIPEKIKNTKKVKNYFSLHKYLIEEKQRKKNENIVGCVTRKNNLLTPGFDKNQMKCHENILNSANEKRSVDKSRDKSKEKYSADNDVQVYGSPFERSEKKKDFKKEGNEQIYKKEQLCEDCGNEENNDREENYDWEENPYDENNFLGEKNREGERSTSSEWKNRSDEINVNILEDEKKYSRQMYTHGYKAEKEIKKSKILIIGLNGTSSEICKNLILCGVKEIGIYDNHILTNNDVDNLFFCDKKLINKEKRSISCVQNMQNLNDNCKIKAITTNIFNSITDYDIIVSVNQRELFNININNLCRQEKKKFICVNTVGLFGRVFVDFGHFTFTNVMNSEQYKISNIAFQEDNLILHYLPYYNDIQINDKDRVKLCIKNANKMMNIECEVKNVCRGNNTITVSVIGVNFWHFASYALCKKILKYLEKIFFPYYIHFVTKLRKKLAEIYIQNLRDMIKKNKLNQVSVEKMHEQTKLNYTCLEEYLKKLKKKLSRGKILSYVLDFLSMSGNTNELSDEEVCFLCYDEIWKSKNEDEKIFPTDEIVKKFKILCKKKKKNMNVQIINQFLSAVHIELAPFSSFFGSLVTQQILKGITHKFKPIYQIFYFDKRDLFPFSKISKTYDGRYMNQLNFFGKNFQNFLNNLNILLIGSGALGCEFLKLLSLIGVSSSIRKRKIYSVSKAGHEQNNEQRVETKKEEDSSLKGEIEHRKIKRGGIIQIVDYDLIEESNLTRQFLFTTKDIGKLKCQVAADNIKKINEDINCLFLKMKVDESVLSNRDLLLKQFYVEEEKSKVQDVERKNMNGAATLFTPFEKGKKKKTVLCILCLDNLKSRVICDEFCLMNSLPFIETGIEGLKGSSQIIMPFSSETYSSNSYDKEGNEEKSNSCTITSFPKNHNHIIEFSKSVYNNFFFDNVLKMNCFLNDPVYYFGHLCNYDNISNLVHFFNLTKIFFNLNFEENVHKLWNSIFVNNIINLLSNNKEDILKYYDGNTQSLPQPIYYNKQNKDHLLFYKCAINTFKKVLKNLMKIKPDMIDHIFYYKNWGDKKNGSNSVDLQIALTNLVEKNGLVINLKKLFYFLSVIKKNTNLKFYAIIEKELYDLFNNPLFIMSLIYVQKRNGKVKYVDEKKKKQKEQFPFFTPLICNLEDNKDDINFIFSITNVRSENYNFSKLNILDFFKICNNIIPSIVTVVSMIASLAMFEFYKVAYFLKLSERKGEEDQSNRPVCINKRNIGKTRKMASEMEKMAEIKFCLKKLFSNHPNETVRVEKFKNLNIRVYKNVIYVQKGNKTLFYFFNIEYDKLARISSLLSNQYINLGDNFLTKCELNKLYTTSYENASIPLLKNVKFTLWNYIYIDIFRKNKINNNNQNNQNCTLGVCGFPSYIFTNQISVLSKEEKKNIKKYLDQVNKKLNNLEKVLRIDKPTGVDTTNKDFINEKEKCAYSSKNKITREHIDKIIKEIDLIFTFMDNEIYNKYISNVTSDKAFLNYVRANMCYVKKKIQLIEGGQGIGKEACTTVQNDLAYITMTVKNLQKNIEEIKSNVLLFFSINNTEENKKDITLDEFVRSVEQLFNVTIQTIGVKDKIIYSNFQTVSSSYCKQNYLYDILHELFKDQQDMKTFVLHIFATDNVTRAEIVLPDVQVNVHYHT
ncbi:ubiquitin-activating enzyme, putative [Plasmodium malariae]|uniref:Ubiquitin-activating enzyme, putative n=1 Tax=Plasmodium malariae TaxID=5858 RepID=A0A1C3L0Q1_PLAMA|nr:ubiquitin-activating enzyme, putative [Plasmodium malariae]